MSFERAESQQGSCLYDPVRHAVICNLGHLPRGAVEPIQIAVRAALGGTWTNSISVRANAEVMTNNNFSQVITFVSGPTGKLSISKTAAGQIELDLQGAPAQSYRLERSADLKIWQPSSLDPLDPSWPALLLPDATQGFYRARGR
jgi:hypothetical protein